MSTDRPSPQAPTFAPAPIPAAPLLSYADPVNQYGVFVSREPGVMRLILPPARGTRMFFTWHVWALLVLGGHLALSLFIGRCYFFEPFAIAGVLWHMLYTIWRRRVFMVTAGAVSVGRQTNSGFAWDDMWPRASVASIDPSPSGEKLVFSLASGKTKTWFISGSPHVTRFVAETLSIELRDAGIGVPVIPGIGSPPPFPSARSTALLPHPVSPPQARV